MVRRVPLVLVTLGLISGSCTRGADDGNAAPEHAAETSTATSRPILTRIDLPTDTGGAVADDEGVWVPSGDALRLDVHGRDTGVRGHRPFDPRAVAGPGPMAASDGRLFIASTAGLDEEGGRPPVFGWIARLDRRTGATERTRLIHDGHAGPPDSLSVGKAGLWATTGTSLVQFDMETLETVAIHAAHPPTGTGIGSIAVGDNAVFAANAAAKVVERFDAATGRRTHQASVSRRTGGLPLVVTGSSLWAGGQDELVELDPQRPFGPTPGAGHVRRQRAQLRLRSAVVLRRGRALRPAHGQ